METTKQTTRSTRRKNTINPGEIEGTAKDTITTKSEAGGQTELPRHRDSEGSDTAETQDLGLATVKPKRKRTVKKKPVKLNVKDDPMIVGMMEGLISTVFGLVSMRAGDHWTLSDKEVQKLTQPIIGIMDRYGVLDSVAKNSEFIALGLAISSVVVPRAVVSYQFSKIQKEKVKSNVQISEQSIGTSTGENTETGTLRENDRSNEKSSAAGDVADYLKQHVDAVAI